MSEHRRRSVVGTLLIVSCSTEAGCMLLVAPSSASVRRLGPGLYGSTVSGEPALLQGDHIPPLEDQKSLDL